MIIAAFTRDSSGRICGYTVQGHAGYAKAGNDIICAAVSVLAINTANALESLVRVPVEASESEEGILRCHVSTYQDPQVQLLMETLLLGLRSIQEAYGKAFLEIREQ